MNKKTFALVLVILISFSFLSIVVADNITNDGDDATDHDDTVDVDNDTDDDNDTSDKDNDDKNNTDDKDDSTDENKTPDKSKKDYILAKGHGNDIKFSDGFRGFILDYSKKPAKSGDEFKSVSASKAHNSNTLKQAIIQCYIQNSTDNIGKIMADFVKKGYSNTKVGEAVEDSHEKIDDDEIVEIDNDTGAVFEFEVLKSVSGNESDYFAYKVSFVTLFDDENETNSSNETVLANITNETNVTNETNETNITNATNITNDTVPGDNETNATLLKEFYDYLVFLASSLYDAWAPFIDTLMNEYLMFMNALEELCNLYEYFMTEIQALLDAIEELLGMLQSMWTELAGLFKLLEMIFIGIEQLINLLASTLNFLAGLLSSIISLVKQFLGLLYGLIRFLSNLISMILSWVWGLISAVISLIQWLLGLLYGLISFLSDLLNQLMSLIHAILDLFKSAGSFLANVIENAFIIIAAFVLVTIGALVYERIK